MTDLDDLQLPGEQSEEERQLQELLTMPMAEPPSGLADRLKADIPADLGAANDHRAWTPRRPWLTLAAALVTVIGALLLTFELRRDMPAPGFGQPASEAARAAPELQRQAEGATASDSVGARQEARVAPSPSTADRLRAPQPAAPQPAAVRPADALPAPIQPAPIQPAPAQQAQAVSEDEVYELQRLPPRQPSPAATSATRSPAPAERQRAVGRTENSLSAETDSAEASISGTNTAETSTSETNTAETDTAETDTAETDTAEIGMADGATSVAASEQESILEEERKLPTERLGFNGTADSAQAAAVDSAAEGWPMDPRLERLRRFLQHRRWPSPELVEASQLLEVFDRPDLQPVASAFVSVLERPVSEHPLDLMSLSARLQPQADGDADPQAAELIELIELASRMQRAATAADD